jgi:hypothetical protein
MSTNGCQGVISVNLGITSVGNTCWESIVSWEKALCALMHLTVDITLGYHPERQFIILTHATQTHLLQLLYLLWNNTLNMTAYTKGLKPPVTVLVGVMIFAAKTVIRLGFIDAL